jgi:hypothetical protein
MEQKDFKNIIDKANNRLALSIFNSNSPSIRFKFF